MSKIVVLSLPAYGHINPLLPIVAELVRRGHTVTVFNESQFETLFRATGADFVAYPPVLSLDDLAKALVDGDLIAWLELLLTATAPLVGFVVSKTRADPPDLLVHDGVCIWGPMVKKRLRVPSVAISTSFIFEFSRDLQGPGELWLHLRSLFPRLPRIVMAWIRMVPHGGVRNLPLSLPLFPRLGDLTLLLTSKQVHPPSSFFDNPRVAFVGCSIDAATRPESFDFSRLDGRPLIYASLGTLHHANIAFFETCMEALGDYPAQVLLSVGRGTDIAQFKAIPSNFIVAETFPQLEILQRASLFITHAGLNSVHEGLWFGVPMVAVPQQFEQLRNAQAVSRAGAGLTIDSEVYGKPVTATALRTAVDAAMAGHAGFKARAAELGTSLHEAGGYRRAASLIEGMMGPVRRSDSIHHKARI